MSDEDGIEEIRKGLKSIKPKTKVARLNQVMPDILERLDEGIKIVDLVDVLKDNGLEIDISTLRNYIYRYRKSLVSKEKRSFEEAPVVSAKSETVVRERKDLKEVLRAQRAGNVAPDYMKASKSILKGYDK